MYSRTIPAAGIAALALFVPVLASAQTVENLLTRVQLWGNMIIAIVFTIAIIAFFWGLVKYLWSNGEDAKASGLKTMLYGLLAIFVMLSIYGIVRLLQRTFTVDQNNTSIQPPVVPTGGINWLGR